MRGRVICCFQLFTSGAIALGFFVCYGTIKIQSSMSWRLPFAISAFVGLGVALTVPFLPFSPRWLVTHGRSDEAQRVLNLITGPEDDDERRELLAVSPSGDSAGWLDIFDEGVRGRTILGAFLNVSRCPFTKGRTDINLIVRFRFFNSFRVCGLEFSYKKRLCLMHFSQVLISCSTMRHCSSRKPALTRIHHPSSLLVSRAACYSPQLAWAHFTWTTSAVAR